MGKEEIITDAYIQKILSKYGWGLSTPDEGRLTLAELIIKAGSGYQNSHTEEAFLNSFGFLRKDRSINKAGCRFLCSMFYASSNCRPLAYSLMNKYRV